MRRLVMISIFKAVLCAQMSLACAEASEAPKGWSVGSDMPQVPFEVYYSEYQKTVHVVASCEVKTQGSITLIFDSKDTQISNVVFAAVTRAFDQPGITKIQICRKGN